MISKKTSFVVTGLLMAASAAHASIATDQPHLTTISAEADKKTVVATLLEQLSDLTDTVTPAQADLVALHPICDVISNEEWRWQFGCN